MEQNHKVNIKIRLRECPFCGGEAQIFNAPYNQDIGIPCFGIGCKVCKVMIGTTENDQTDFYRSALDAAVAWNCRDGLSADEVVDFTVKKVNSIDGKPVDD